MGYLYGPKVNESFIFPVAVLNVSDGEHAVNPTIAAGDFKRSIGGGAFTDLTNLPSISPAGGRQLIVDLTVAENPGPFTLVQFVDQTVPKAYHDNAWCLYPTTVGSGSGAVITVNPSAFIDSEAIANLLGPYLANLLNNVINSFTAGEKAQLLAMIATLAEVKAKTDQLLFTGTALQVIVQSFATAAQADLRAQDYASWSEAGNTVAELTAALPRNPTRMDILAWLVHITSRGGVQNNTSRTVKDYDGVTIATQPLTPGGSAWDWSKFV